MPDRIENGIAYLNGAKIGDIYGSNYIEISNAGVLSFHGTAKIDDESSSANEFSHIIIDGASTTGIYVSGAAVTGLKFDNATTQRAIDIQITPTTADRQLYMDIDYGANSKEAAYIISSSAKTSGETTALRARGQGKAEGVSTAEIRGVHAQGIAYEALYAGTVNAIYAEAIAKGTSTVTTIRGAMIACDSEGTPTAIGTMIGAHIRIKTSVAPGTAFYGTIIETEKFGSGVIANSLLDLRSTTWAAGEESVVTLIDMSNFGSKASHSHIRFPIAATLDGDSAVEGDFWYDATAHVFKYRDNVGVKTITAA